MKFLAIKIFVKFCTTPNAKQKRQQQQQQQQQQQNCNSAGSYNKKI